MTIELDRRLMLKASAALMASNSVRARQGLPAATAADIPPRTGSALHSWA